MNGQRKFLRPGRPRLEEMAEQYRERGNLAGAWLGPATAYRLVQQAALAPPAPAGALLDQAEAEMRRFPYMFAAEEDGDPYLWLARLGCYSPIIHLQQTNGQGSAHLPFTERWNATGIIHPAQVLAALARSYAAPAPAGLPPRCAEIYLTLEVFAATADLPVDILAGLQASVAYWRRWVPRDGVGLDELLLAG